MRTHEFARHLEQLVRLLRNLPDTELDPKNPLDIQQFIPGMRIGKKKSTRQLRPLPIDIVDKLSVMSPANIESFLLSDDDVFTSINLSDLAGRLGLTSSKRQNKNALVNMITRHYEALNMHSIMRGSESKEANS